MTDKACVAADLTADRRRVLVRHGDVTARAPLVLGAVLHVEAAIAGRQLDCDGNGKPPQSGVEMIQPTVAALPAVVMTLTGPPFDPG